MLLMYLPFVIYSDSMQMFLDSLPKYGRTTDVKKVEDFFGV